MVFIAHRCNSLRKLNEAHHQRYKWIEVDVILRRGKLVLFHDMGTVIPPSKHHAKRPIPLTKALEWLEVHPSITLILDLKCMALHRNLYRTALLTTLKPYSSLKSRLVLTSFNHLLLTSVRTALPDWTYGAIIEAALVDLPTYLQTHLGFCTYVMLSHHIYDKVTVSSLKKNFQVGVYTVNNPAMWPIIRSLGVKFIFRDP